MIATPTGKAILLGRAGAALPWYLNGSALANSLVALWKLDEASGVRADAIGTNTLTDNNTVMSAAGMLYPLAADFELDNSESLSIADNAALEMGNIDFWLAAWVKLESKSASNEHIAGKYTLTGSQRAYRLLWEPAGDQFRIQVSNDGASSVQVNSTAAVSLATWYFVLGWHDSVGDTINIQVNNGSVFSTAFASGVLGTGTQQFALGSVEGTSQFFDGLIGPVMVGKNYVPTVADRTFLWNGGLGRA